MRIGDLVWARWETGLVGVIVKTTYTEEIGEVYYRIHWITGLWTKESLEFAEDLVTVEEKCK
tara:strand:+ start:1376 stop:1561 length:186 start_codon:yes stop_codon:yes gene_type:complete